MSQSDDERRLLRFIAERGGPAATTNVTGRSGEVGVDADALPALVDALVERGLVEPEADGDLRLTALGQSFVELLGS